MNNFLRCLSLLILLGIVTSCGSTAGYESNESEAPDFQEFQAMSLLGDSLTINDFSESAFARLKANLDTAQTNFNNDPSEMNYIWLGRRYAYLMDYRKAIDIYTKGLEKYPDSYKLYRHRGHRYISVREFDKAVADYQKAHEMMPKGQMDTEPDGAPNSMNIPLGNTQFNILYHYGLAHYLKGEFDKAEPIYRECMEYSNNNDLIVATSDWLYMTLSRLGKADEAVQVLEAIDSDMEIIENDSYFKRLKMYKGEMAPEDVLIASGDDVALSLATQGYGVANWYLYNGNEEKAKEILNQVMGGTSWSAFGYIASESDLSRMND